MINMNQIVNNYNTTNAINRKTYEEYFGPNIKTYCPNKKYFQNENTNLNFQQNKGLEKIIH
jgi:hypothetical protein